MSEIPPTVLSPTWTAILEVVKALGPTITAVAGGLWIAFAYLNNQRELHHQQAMQAQKDNLTRLVEAQKPFSATQLELYKETAQVVGRLTTTEQIHGDEWRKDTRRYYQLFWTELSMVEDQGVKAAMQSFSQQIQIVQSKSDATLGSPEFEELRQRSYRLARALRASVEASWHLDLNSKNSDLP